jgi:uncharacterized membrane protein YphA (DoxX/SURF4 family)
MAENTTNPFDAMKTQAVEFFLWSFIAITVISLVFFISISRTVEKIFDPFLFSIKKHSGLLIGRITLGLSLIASGYHQAVFGPELAFTHFMSPDIALYLKWVFIALGVTILLGFMTRIASFIVLAIFLFFAVKVGPYITTYTNHLGEIIIMLFLGQHLLSLDKSVFRWSRVVNKLTRAFEPYAFLVMRVSFGISLIYASIYAKFIHSDLALNTVLEYNLTDYFHFDPLFIVLGALIIEVLLGIFFIIGFEVRFAAFLLSIFLVLSLLYFGEAVWPHIVLFGVALALFVHGYDRYTLEGRFFKDTRHEPVL